jgi:WD40 repeat protein
VLPNDHLVYFIDEKLKVLAIKDDYKLIKEISLKGYDPVYVCKLLHNEKLAFTCFEYESEYFPILILDYNNDYTCVKTIVKHSQNVTCIINLPDNRFASGSDDKSIKIWSTGVYERLQSLNEHTRAVCSLLYIERERLLISGSKGIIKIWNIVEYDCIKTIKVQEDNYIKSLLLLPGGNFISYCYSTANIWNNRKNYMCLRTFKVRDTVFMLTLKDGRIAFSTKDGTIVILNY